MKIRRIRFVIVFTVMTISILLAAHSRAKVTSPPPQGTNYQLNAVITNTPAATVAVINGPPLFGEFASNSAYGIVYTDGSGKIDGVEDMIFTNLNLGGGPFDSGDFITQIGGSISSVGKSNTVTVTMTLKGNGYVQNDLGSTQSQASLNLSFSGKLFPSNSVLSFTTNTFLEIGTNNSFPGGFTNVYTYLPETNYTFVSGYQTLDISYLTGTSTTVTNTVRGTNTVLVQDQICQSDCVVNFGVPTGTPNTIPFGQSCAGCTNGFTNLVVIGTNIAYRSIGTNIIGGRTHTNYIYGLDITNLAAYIAAVTACNTITNAAGAVQSISAVQTNTVASTSSTNVTLYAQIVIRGGSCNFATNNVAVNFSNGWFEVDGVLKGRITAGRWHQNFNGSNASFSLPFTSYTTFIGSGSNTSAPFFGTGCPVVSSNDAGVLYVVREDVVNNDLSVIPAAGTFNNATIKQFGNAIYASVSGAFYGAGAMNPKKQTYSLGLKGVGYLHGSSLVVTGATGIDIVGYTLETNLVTLTNFAAIPPVAGTVTNTTFFTGGDTFFVPLQTIAGIFVGGGNYDFFTLATNGVGTTNITVTNISICQQVAIPPLVVTNTVDCIRSIFGRGTVLGQKISVSGTNADVAYPGP